MYPRILCKGRYLAFEKTYGIISKLVIGGVYTMEHKVVPRIIYVTYQKSSKVKLKATPCDKGSTLLTTTPNY